MAVYNASQSSKRALARVALTHLMVMFIWSFLVGCSGSEESTSTPTPDADVNFGTWTWVAGDDVKNKSGVYGIKNVTDSLNKPGGRSVANSWQDNQGKAWVFGGDGYGNIPSLEGVLNDLWHWDGINWVWVSGSQSINQPGSYGTLGITSLTNMPGARTNATMWSDNSGNFWLFGGVGFDSAGGLGWLNDLWMWNGIAWTWLAGSDIRSQSGIYGVIGVSATGNTPGGRTGAQSWIAANGDLWLFSGGGYDKDGINGDLNDMWRWDGNAWTWMSGSSDANQGGVYGTKGIAEGTNVPGGRIWSASWKDSAGDFWVFSGQGRDSQVVRGLLNDLWRWDGTNWTWFSGSQLSNQLGVYGVKGTAESSNILGGRRAAASWLDSSGKVWVFGGNTRDANGFSGQLNDLWVWNGLNWTWMSGSDEAQLAGAIFGTKGVPTSSNRPSGRTDSVAWIDSNDHLWLFSGSGTDINGQLGRMNDLWRYEPE